MNFEQKMNHLRTLIRMGIDTKSNRFIIFPFGVNGMLVKYILEEQFGIEPEYIIDNKLSKTNPNIKPIEFLKGIDTSLFTVLLTSDNSNSEDIRQAIFDYVAEENIFDLFYQSRNPRIAWLKDFSDNIYNLGIKGSVAECGVWQGHFAKFINLFFPDRKLYLFDPFEGFRESDVNYERKNFTKADYARVGCFDNTSIDIVMEKMHYPKNVEVRKGYIPESAEGIEDDFCFVSLDMDLYQPMLEGLKIFYPRMTPGGVILLHDWFYPECPGVKQALLDYENIINKKLYRFSIGDYFSMAIMKRD